MKYIEKTVEDFTSELASSQPTPGGGGAAALVGALGIALGNMVGALTVGKPKYAEHEGEIRMLMAEASRIEKELLHLVEEDAEGFKPLAEAYGIPKDNPDRARILEDATKAACIAPMAMMRACARAMEIIERFKEIGSRLAISDAGCAAVLCKSAMQAAALNVYINTKSMVDRDYADELNGEVEELLDEYCDLADEIYEDVTDTLIE
ncbi:MAG: cyclodeaminase/cyclohydrolase family protein [Firmicutes bacterium]|nr:cyclodeaminase/cyclohydrolase family protein [Bacillota bacterium]